MRVREVPGVQVAGDGGEGEGGGARDGITGAERVSVWRVQGGGAGSAPGVDCGAAWEAAEGGGPRGSGGGVGFDGGAARGGHGVAGGGDRGAPTGRTGGTFQAWIGGPESCGELRGVEAACCGSALGTTRVADAGIGGMRVSGVRADSAVDGGGAASAEGSVRDDLSVVSSAEPDGMEPVPDLPAVGVEGLSEEQKKAVRFLLAGDTDQQVGRLLRLPVSTVARWRQGELGEALEAGERESLERARRKLSKLTPRAVQELKRIIGDSEAPPGTRCKAAALVLEYAERLAQLRAGGKARGDRVVLGMEETRRRVVEMLGAGMGPERRARLLELVAGSGSVADGQEG